MTTPIEKQNAILDTTIKLKKEDYTMNNQKSYYQQLENHELKKYYGRLFYIYYLILILVFYLLYNNSYKFQTKIMITIGLIIYPYVIWYIEYYAFHLFYFIYCLLIGIPYPY